MTLKETILGMIISSNILPMAHIPKILISKYQRALRTLAAQYGLLNGHLCKKGSNGQSLLCIDQPEATRLMENTHKGVCGPHTNGKMLSKIISRQGYYWSTMEHDCIQYVKKCPECQMFANLQHLPPSTIQTIQSHSPLNFFNLGN